MSDSGPPKIDTQRLQGLLEATLSPDEEARLLAELDQDESRWQLLENIAAEPQFRDDVREYLGHQPPDPSIARILSSIDGAGLDAEQTPLDFLEPAESDEFIGRFDGYQIVECIGSGGMGIVLKAFDPSLNRIVALKVLSPHLAANVNSRKRFLREARAAAAVSHDHVITIHAVSESAGLPYLVMEFIRGVSLQEKINDEGPLEFMEILRIGAQIASGLAAAHAQGLIHRDVKPGNILLENGIQRVKITDFGLARAVDDGSVTRSGMIVGTPEYMSPEQARGEPLDARADLFSLGNVLYAMCTGESPFRAGTLAGTIRRVCDQKPRPIRELNPDIPRWLIAVVDKLHAKSAADRIQSAAEVAELLTGHLAAVQQGADPAGREMTTYHRSLWLFCVGVIALLAVGLALGSRMLISSSDESAAPERLGKLESATVEADQRHEDSLITHPTPDAERAVAVWTMEKNGMVTLHDLTRIERLEDLPGGKLRVRHIRLSQRGLNDGDLDRFHGLAELQGLELEGNHLTDAALAALTEIPTLRWLYIGKTSIGDAELHRLQQLQVLESLGLDGTRVTDEGLLRIRRLDSLRELLLGNTAVTDATLVHLKTFPTLVRLNLFGTGITDDGLRHLQALPNLTYLVLQQTAITDAGLEHLKSLATLKEVNLKQTQVTSDGVAGLEQALPECRIEH